MSEMIEINEEHISMIMRQTDYTRETAQQKLQEHKNNLMSVIREYMAPPSSVLTSGLTPGPAPGPGLGRGRGSAERRRPRTRL